MDLGLPPLPAPTTEARPAAPPQAKVSAEDLVFTTVGEASATHGIKMLAYGGAGTGKTHLCLTLPKPIIISAEAGLLTARKMIHEGKLDANTPVIEVKDIATVEAARDWIRQNAKQHGILSIGLDSISEITERCLAAERSKTKDPRQAYGEMAVRVVELVKEFRDMAGFHVLVTAKQTQRQDPVTGVEKAQPTAPGQQVGPALPYLFDIVLHAYTDKDHQGKPYWALRTAAAFNAEAKDRSGVLSEIEYPDADYLINKILADPEALARLNETETQS